MYRILQVQPVTKYNVSNNYFRVDNDGKISAGNDVKATVSAEIVGEVKGDTVIAYKQKRRKGFRKKHGHRTLYTQIKVTGIA